MDQTPAPKKPRIDKAAFPADLISERATRIGKSQPQVSTVAVAEAPVKEVKLTAQAFLEREFTRLTPADTVVRVKMLWRNGSKGNFRVNVHKDGKVVDSHFLIVTHDEAIGWRYEERKPLVRRARKFI